jgi:hypothetical protein
MSAHMVLALPSMLKAGPVQLQRVAVLPGPMTRRHAGDVCGQLLGVRLEGARPQFLLLQTDHNLARTLHAQVNHACKSGSHSDWLIDDGTRLFLHLPLHPFCFPLDLRGCHLCQRCVMLTCAVDEGQ